MKSEIVLADGNKRVIVIEAIRMVIDAMESDHEAGVVEIFVEVSKDADGNVSPVAEGKIELIHKDGKLRAMEEGETNFLMFCKSEGVMPRDPANPWKNDYSGTTWQNHIYRISVAELRLFAARYGVIVAVTEAPPAPEQTNSETQEGITPEDELAALFDTVSDTALEKMFPDDGRWGSHAERAARNGLSVAREGRGKFNPYRAAIWWLNKRKPHGWDLARVHRTLANNLPARSLDSKHFLTGEIE